MTFTKKWVNRIMWFACIWISLSYVLAFKGYVEIAESLSSTVTTGVIGVMATYFCKSYFETREEKRQNFREQRYEDSLYDQFSASDSYGTDNAEG